MGTGPLGGGGAMPRLCIYSCVLGPHGGSPRGQGDRDQAVFTGAAIYFLMQSKWVQELEPVRASVTGKMDTEATKMGTVQCREDTFRVSEQVWWNEMEMERVQTQGLLAPAPCILSFPLWMASGASRAECCWRKAALILVETPPHVRQWQHSYLSLIITHVTKETSAAQKGAWLTPGHTASQRQPRGKSSGLWTPGPVLFPHIPCSGAHMHTWACSQLYPSVSTSILYLRLCIWPQRSLSPTFLLPFCPVSFLLLISSSNRYLISTLCQGLCRARERERGDTVPGIKDLTVTR